MLPVRTHQICELSDSLKDLGDEHNDDFGPEPAVKDTFSALLL